MSIINNDKAGSHIESLFLLDRLISDFSRAKSDEFLTEAKIKDNCVPPYLLLETNKDESGQYKIKTNPTRKLKESLDFWREQGLWQKNEQGDVRAWSELDCSDNLPARLLKLIASKQYDFLHGTKIEPLLRYLTLFLAIDKYTMVGKQVLNREEASRLISGVVDTTNVGRMNLNTSELKGFFEYAYVLGFLEHVDKENYFVDPTRALNVLLRSNLTVNQDLPCEAFLARLNQDLPIFDQGEYRQLIEETVVHDNDQWTPGQGIRLSAGLSIALYRLQRQGILTFRMGSDSATRFNLTLPTGENTVITHLTYLGESV
ncbi:protein DpdG [Vibrio pomeroyi]|uniref:protein DpdG n=1 Tax=Vibrio pomeroyi TaxID=198832 RepID=UPI0021C478E9|nr:protein DpdG [Vibrio pomeroyi]